MNILTRFNSIFDTQNSMLLKISASNLFLKYFIKVHKFQLRYPSKLSDKKGVFFSLRVCNLSKFRGNFFK